MYSGSRTAASGYTLRAVDGEFESTDYAIAKILHHQFVQLIIHKFGEAI